MLEERSRRNSLLFSDGMLDGVVVSRFRDADSVATISVSSSLPTSSESSSNNSPVGAKYIEHRVSKMDTLAGVAIKYGVEVTDIKRLNGLVTDLQMFAHKSLHIPLPGRHPPSCTLNGSMDGREQTPPRPPRHDVLDSLPSLRKKKPPHKISSAMNSLHGYYGLTPLPPKRGPVLEGSEMAVYKSGFYLDGEPKESASTDPLPNRHRKSRSVVNGFSSENIDDKAVLEAVDNSDSDRSIRRRQKTDGGPSLYAPELLLKEENRNGFSGRKGKGLTLRPKGGSRTDMDMGYTNGNVPDGDSLLSDERLVSVRKSSSTSCLQEPLENNISIWATSKWAFKPDAFARPILDGLPKSRRNKAALD